MLSREHIYTLIMLRHREGNFFSELPMELMEQIIGVEPESHGDIAKALHYAAYARQEDVDALLKMLEANPRLLLEAGNVITPGGDEIRRITIYEFLLGAGDYELAQTVQGYFAKIKDEQGNPLEDAETQKIRQYERYRPHIEGMLTQKPYDLFPLIDLIKRASAQDIHAQLNNDMTHKSALRDAILQFRSDWAPRKITKACMHYNHASLQHAFKLLDNEWENLHQANNGDFGMIHLVCRQLIGFEMRRLPGIDRCIFAQGVYWLLETHQALARSYKFKYGLGTFPIIGPDDSTGELGVEFGAGLLGEKNRDVPLFMDDKDLLEKYIAHKNLKLTELMQPEPVYQSPKCSIL